jgi:hypothetical protein
MQRCEGLGVPLEALEGLGVPLEGSGGLGAAKFTKCQKIVLYKAF